MTPSGWHDDAKNRDAGHDELQAAVFRWLKLQSRKPRETRHNHGDHGYTLQSTDFVSDLVEADFADGGRILCFADVCRSWKITETFYRRGAGDQWIKERTELKGYVREIYEIKPKIYSAGAAIRQMITLSHIIKGITYKSDYMQAKNYVRAFLVVPWTDPKIDICQEFGCDVLPWDGDAPRSDNEPDEDGVDHTLG